MGGLSSLLTTVGGVMYFHSYSGGEVLLLGLLGLIVTFYI
jgi:hypothetical protein